MRQTTRCFFWAEVLIELDPVLSIFYIIEHQLCLTSGLSGWIPPFWSCQEIVYNSLLEGCVKVQRWDLSGQGQRFPIWGNKTYHRLMSTKRLLYIIFNFWILILFSNRNYVKLFIRTATSLDQRSRPVTCSSACGCFRRCDRNTCGPQPWPSRSWSRRGKMNGGFYGGLVFHIAPFLNIFFVFLFPVFNFLSP